MSTEPKTPEELAEEAFPTRLSARLNCAAAIRKQAEQDGETVAALIEELASIAAFANGNGDVCEIIARRARTAIQKASVK